MALPKHIGDREYQKFVEEASKVVTQVVTELTVTVPITKTGNYSVAQTDTIIWSPISGKKIVLIAVTLSTDTIGRIEIEDDSHNDVIPPMYFAANGGAVICGQGAIWKGGTDVKLTVTSNITGNHSVLLWGYETD